MRKYFNEEGKEVKFGDTVSVSSREFYSPFGVTVTNTCSTEFKEGMQDVLEAAGWITHEDLFEVNKAAVIRYLADNMNISMSETIKTLKHLVGCYTPTVTHLVTMAVFNILYKGHYSDIMHEEKVFGLVKHNPASIIELGKPSIAHLGTVAMFKSREEAEEASKLVQSVIKYLNDRK